MARKAFRCVGLALIGVAALAGLRSWRQKRNAERDAEGAEPKVTPPTLTSVPDLAPEPPTPGPALVPPPEPTPESVAESDDRRWVAPTDDACPPGYLVKVNERSGIYHLPGGLSYDRTRPTRCYRDEAAAEADGFRRAKR